MAILDLEAVLRPVIDSVIDRFLISIAMAAVDVQHPVDTTYVPASRRVLISEAKKEQLRKHFIKHKKMSRISPGAYGVSMIITALPSLRDLSGKAAPLKRTESQVLKQVKAGENDLMKPANFIRENYETSS